MRNEKNSLHPAKGRKISSTRWLARHVNDPCVSLAKKYSYRSRAAFKLLEIDDHFNLISSAKNCIVDLGSSPGSWLQVILERKKRNVHLVGVDLIQIEQIDGVNFLCGDFTKNCVIQKLQEIIRDFNVAINISRNIFNNIPNVPGFGVDLVLSDLAPSTCGVKEVDQARIMQLVIDAFHFAKKNLKIGGNFVAKIFTCDQQQVFKKELHQYFKKVEFLKPKASYSNSSEIFVVGMNFHDRIKKKLL